MEVNSEEEIKKPIISNKAPKRAATSKTPAWRPIEWWESTWWEVKEWPAPAKV